MGSNTAVAENFANFSVVKPKTDPFTVVDRRYVGHDGFVVPKDFGEFYERFPQRAQLGRQARGQVYAEAGR